MKNPHRSRQGAASFILLKGLLALIAIGTFVTWRMPNQMRETGCGPECACRANLKQLDAAKEEWAYDNHRAVGSPVAWNDLIGTYIKAWPACPKDGKYILGRIGTLPTCTNEEHVLPEQKQ